MKLITMVGLSFFLRSLIMKRSLSAFLVIVNGLIYHGLRSDGNYNKGYIRKLRYYDIFTNIVLITIKVVNNPTLIPYASMAIINFLFHFTIVDKLLLLNMNIVDERKKTIFKECFHVFGVQFPLAIGLEKVLGIQ